MSAASCPRRRASRRIELHRGYYRSPTCGLMTTILESKPAPRGFVEKTALERYVAPAKPSLVGLTRAAAGRGARRRSACPSSERKMRVQQLWHWIYVRGAHALRRR